MAWPSSDGIGPIDLAGRRPSSVLASSRRPARSIAARSSSVSPRAALVDDHGRDGVGVLEGRQLVQGTGRLGAAGQPGRGLVVLDVGQLAGEASRAPARAMTQKASTIHFVTGPVSAPAI